MTGQPAFPLRALTLTLTERCNLHCRYCYVPVDRGREMRREVADAAVDLLLRQAQGDKVSLFFFGGEPFLALSLMQRAAERARAGAPSGLEVEIGATTNGTLLGPDELALCRRAAMRLALSIDGDGGPAERLSRAGEDSTPRVLDRLPGILALEPHGRVTARMTVTPTNVSQLAASVRALSDLGLRRIVYLPAFELPWDEEALGLWHREHRRIATWRRGAAAAGKQPAALPAWRGIEARLLRGAVRRPCGAGTRLAAVAPDGALYPCYRFVFAADAEGYRLGDVHAGFGNHGTIELMRAVVPGRLRPEHGDCARCSARDGCTFFCPALGHWMLRDPWAVPASACRLTIAQVDAMREGLRSSGALRASRVARSVWAGAAVLAAAAAPVAASSCSSEVQEYSPGAGVCPAQTDGGSDADADAPEGGVCPVEDDAGDDGADAADDGPVGGVCPVQVDASDDAADDGPQGGLCPMQIDASDDGGQGGLC